MKINIYPLTSSLHEEKTLESDTSTLLKNLNKGSNQYDLNYFLTKPLGNHHIIVYEDIESKLLTYLRQNKKCKILEILGFKGVFR